MFPRRPFNQHQQQAKNTPQPPPPIRSEARPQLPLFTQNTHLPQKKAKAHVAQNDATPGMSRLAPAAKAVTLVRLVIVIATPAAFMVWPILSALVADLLKKSSMTITVKEREKREKRVKEG